MAADDRPFRSRSAEMLVEAERIGARRFSEILSRFYQQMTDVVFEHGGMLNKYMGDGVMAVFGVTTSRPNAEERAARAALKRNLELRPRGVVLHRGGIALARAPNRRSASCSATTSASISHSTSSVRSGLRSRSVPIALRMLYDATVIIFAARKIEDIWDANHVPQVVVVLVITMVL